MKYRYTTQHIKNEKIVKKKLYFEKVESVPKQVKTVSFRHKGYGDCLFGIAMQFSSSIEGHTQLLT